MSKQADHENASCTSFHPGKPHSAWLKSQCGGCVDNHPWWTHGEWHHEYHHLPPAHCNDVHPSHTHDEFEHKGVSCGLFHTGLDHEDWLSGNLEQPAEETEKEHEQLPCDSVHPGGSHTDWTNEKEHPGNTCDEEHWNIDHFDWVEEEEHRREHPPEYCEDEHPKILHSEWKKLKEGDLTKNPELVLIALKAAREKLTDEELEWLDDQPNKKRSFTGGQGCLLPTLGMVAAAISTTSLIVAVVT